jgi:predicted transcriptional regulator
MKTYQVTLPDEFAAFVDRMIAEKQWETVDQIMIAGLSYVQSDLEAVSELDQAWLKAEIQKGIDSADRGELIDGPTFMAGLMDRLRQKTVAAAQPT